MNERKSAEEEDCRKSLRSGSTNGGTVLPSRCIFCDKASKYKKGSKRLEKMICCAELRVDERIRKIATIQKFFPLIQMS